MGMVAKDAAVRRRGNSAGRGDCLYARAGRRGPAMRRRPARGIKVSINFGFTYWFYLFPWVKIYLVQYVGIPNAEILYIKH